MQEERVKRAEEIFKVIMAGMFPKLKMQESQTVSNRINIKRKIIYLPCRIFKLLKLKTKNLERRQREKEPILSI